MSKPTLSLKELLIKIATDNQAYDKLVEDMPNTVYTQVNNYVGGYDGVDWNMIKEALSTSDFNLIKRINHYVNTKIFTEYKITDYDIVDYCQSVIEGDVKPEDIELPE